MARALILLLAALAAAGCSGGRTESDPARLLGRTLALPDGRWQSTVAGRSAEAPLPEGMKILVWFDGGGCRSCRLKELAVWRNLTDELARLKADSGALADFVFLFRAAPDDESVQERLRTYGLDLPVWFDREGEFAARNVLPEDEAYHTFLLNRNNQILLIGAPIYSRRLWARYKRRIGEMSELMRNGAL